MSLTKRNNWKWPSKRKKRFVRPDAKHKANRLAEIADTLGISRSRVSQVLIDPLKSIISDEMLYFYKRDANGMVTEMERHKVTSNGKTVIEKVRM